MNSEKGRDITLETVTISTQVEAPLAKVWACYTLPDHITRWNFASDDWCCPSAENDLRVGGMLKARMEAKDGSFAFDFVGIYDAVEPEKALSYALEDGRKVCVTFTQTGDGVEVVIQFDAETQNDIEMQRSGWQAILDNFKKAPRGCIAASAHVPDM